MAEAVYLPNHLYHTAPSIKKERSVWAFFFYVHNLQNHKNLHYTNCAKFKHNY